MGVQDRALKLYPGKKANLQFYILWTPHPDDQDIDGLQKGC